MASTRGWINVKRGLHLHFNLNYSHFLHAAFQVTLEVQDWAADLRLRIMALGCLSTDLCSKVTRDLLSPGGRQFETDTLWISSLPCGCEADGQIWLLLFPVLCFLPW